MTNQPAPRRRPARRRPVADAAPTYPWWQYALAVAIPLLILALIVWQWPNIQRLGQPATASSDQLRLCMYSDKPYNPNAVIRTTDGYLVCNSSTGRMTPIGENEIPATSQIFDLRPTQTPMPTAPGILPGLPTDKPASTAAPATSTPAPTQAPSQNGEVQCQHVNGSTPFTINPGQSFNAGQVSFGGLSYEYVNDAIIVLRNTSAKPLDANSTDGGGLCDSSDLNQTLVRFVQGCDPDGCARVLDLNWTDTGLKTEYYSETAFCQKDPNSQYCVQPAVLPTPAP